METESGVANDKAALKFGIMVINTAELKKVLQDDSDFDGITLQVSRVMSGATNGTGAGQPTFRFIAYTHYASRKKQEMISDPKFFATGTEMFKTIEAGDESTSHFGNLKLTRANLQEDIDTNQFPFLVLTPELGTGDHENYIVCKAAYAESLDAATPASQSQSLSRGGGGGLKSIGINPSPPA
ncbi:MAG: hypothetical protein ABI683_13635 [Ginsengibacter sp.]